MKKQFAVFGLGSFGESIALELQKLGCEVVAVDKDMERVMELLILYHMRCRQILEIQNLSDLLEQEIWTLL